MVQEERVTGKIALQLINIRQRGPPISLVLLIRLAVFTSRRSHLLRLLFLLLVPLFLPACRRNFRRSRSILVVVRALDNKTEVVPQLPAGHESERIEEKASVGLNGWPVIGGSTSGFGLSDC